MNSERERFLTQLYWKANTRPGWLPNVTRFFNLPEDECGFLEELDDVLTMQVSATNYRWEENVSRWRKLERRAADWRFLADWMPEEELDEEEDLVRTQEKIAELYMAYNDASKRREPPAARMLMMKINDLKGLEKSRNRILSRRHWRDHSTENPGRGLTDHEIERARTYPLEKLVPDLSQRGYTRCRWHDDNSPSMLVRNGFGWCFSCSTWADSIKWIMVEKAMSFPEAVKHLAAL